MYFAFIDESGTPNLEDKESKFYVLAAVIMKDLGLNFLHSGSEIIKQDIWNIVRKNILLNSRFIWMTSMEEENFIRI